MALPASTWSGPKAAAAAAAISGVTACFSRWAPVLPLRGPGCRAAGARGRGGQRSPVLKFHQCLEATNQRGSGSGNDGSKSIGMQRYQGQAHCEPEHLKMRIASFVFGCRRTGALTLKPPRTARKTKVLHAFLQLHTLRLTPEHGGKNKRRCNLLSSRRRTSITLERYFA